VFAVVTRLAHQKGIHLIQEIIEGLLWQDTRLVLLGSGDPSAEAYFSTLAARHPGKVGVWIGFNEALSHRITAGADFFLMPSLYEPCGLTQMYSLRYGTLPVVHETGGLADSVKDYRPELGAADPDRGRNGTGFRFAPCSGHPFWEACQRARALHADKAELTRVRKLAMKEDFGWARSAQGYELVYRRALASQ
ncbi:MAG TPA: glycosyltransferase, partial [Candidatus Methylacidiphilales bacterium]